MSILEQANHEVQDRMNRYGHPGTNFDRIASFWTTYLGPDVIITERDVAHMMSLVKTSRDRHMASDENLLDICGYMRTAEMLHETPTSLEPLIPNDARSPLRRKT